MCGRAVTSRQGGAENGVSGVRPWAPDYLGDWGPMALFELDPRTHVASAKPALSAFVP